MFARTNAKEIIKRKSLRPEIPVWWRNLQQGMGLVGLGIPALVHWGSPSILLASSHTQDFKEAWGSEPEIEGRVRCAGLSAIHDGYEATRQTKVAYIADVCRREGIPCPKLAVCSRPYVRELNCNTCEKCLRTMIGIIVAGGDVEALGFSIVKAEDLRVHAEGLRDPSSLGLVAAG